MENNLIEKPKTEIMVSSSPHPFMDANQFNTVLEGENLSNILKIVQPDEVLRDQAHIWINDELVPEDMWEEICPTEGDFVYISVIPGKGGKGKNTFRTIAMVAVIASAALISGGALGPLAAGLKATATFNVLGATLSTAQVVGAVVGGVGMLAVNALVPPARASSPNMPSLSNTQDSGSPTLFIEGARNAPRLFGTIPVVLGVHRNVPPLGGNTYTEIIGNNEYLRMLVIWGYGRLKIEDIKIGETAIGDFDGVEIETFEGVEGDSTPTLFPAAVVQDAFGISLTFDDGWQQRTTSTNTDEISVDIVFANGLAQFDNEGNVDGAAGVHEIEYRAVGDVVWLTPTFTAHTLDSDSSISGSQITINGAAVNSVRHGFRWAVTRGQYEVRIRRTNASFLDDPTINSEATWTVLRSFNNDPLITFPHPLAMSAISIKATDQLNGVIDQLSATVSSYVTDFGGSAWSTAVSSNPASLFRHVLQSPAYVENVADSRIDLDTLETFHTFCATNNFEFNMIRDFKASIWDTLSDICSAGRAVPVDLDGKWSVVIDQQKTTPVQKFTPRNSFGFEAEKVFVDSPHGFKMKFPNREKGWQQDELIVYDDGFSASNATKFEQLDGIGITDKDHLWKHGRFNLAGIRLRPERYTFNVDFEHIIARKGDLILLAHDVLLVGIAQGRITAIQTDSAGDVTGITVDETFTMEAGKSYGVSIRTVGDAAVVKTIVLDVGDQTTITFDSVIASASAPIVGDLVAFGISGSETLECIVLAIESQSDLVAQVIAIPHSSPSMYTADTGTIPAFDSKITTPAGLPDVNIEATRTDESVLVRGAGDTLIPRISIMVTPVANSFNASLKAKIKLTGTDTNFEDAQVDFQSGNEIIISGVFERATYDVKLQWTSPNFLVNGNFSFANNILVIGQTSVPDPLSNMNISGAGGSAIIRWDMPTDLDVRFGGTVQFRHSHETDSANATWNASVSIGTTSQGSDLIATLPLKAGTYLARVFDKGGRASTVTKVDTKQVALGAFSAPTNITEEPDFTGTHSNTIAVDNVLKLLGTTSMDSWADVDLVVDWDSEGGVVASGTYDFVSMLDLTTVTRTRLTTDINIIITNVLDNIDSWVGNIDDREDWDGDVTAEADARVQVRVTDDDPATSAASWSAWNDLDSAEYVNRGFDFRVNLTSNNVSFNPTVSKLQVNSEVLS